MTEVVMRVLDGLRERGLTSRRVVVRTEDGCVVELDLEPAAPRGMDDERARVLLDGLVGRETLP